MIGTEERRESARTRAGSGRQTKVIGLGAVILLALVAIGVVPRLMRDREALAASKDAPVTHPTVSVARASPGEPSSQIALPGNVEPLYTAALFARVNGYVQQRSGDIGMKVHAGQVLAIISAPEIDQQLSEAEATVGQSQPSHSPPAIA